MNNSQYIEQAKNFWADEDAYAEMPCISCGEEDECTVVCSLQEDDKWIAYVVDHDYKVTIDREGNWETTCEFSELNDAEKIFWNHTAKLYATVPLWMVEAYRGVDVDEAADSLCDDEEEDYDIWGYDEEDDENDEWDEDEDDEFELDDFFVSDDQPTESSLKEFVSEVKAQYTPDETYISPFTGKLQ